MRPYASSARAKAYVSSSNQHPREKQTLRKIKKLHSSSTNTPASMKIALDSVRYNLRGPMIDFSSKPLVAVDSMSFWRLVVNDRSN
mmetsp:Transcript_36562/g.91036  ORF Transcript_36562/g.91036 Transcript_36562/m.91036 type:complete len:86 (+) Transcript_36562:274-531(+)